MSEVNPTGGNVTGRRGHGAVRHDVRRCATDARHAGVPRAGLEDPNVQHEQRRQRRAQRWAPQIL